MHNKSVIFCLIFLFSSFVASCSSSSSSAVTSSESPLITYTYSLNQGESLLQGESFSITATLTSARLIDNQLIKESSLAPLSESIIFSSATTPCYVSSESPACIIVARVESASPETYILTMRTQSPNFTQVNESLTFKVVAAPVIKFTLVPETVGIGESASLIAALTGGTTVASQHIAIANFNPANGISSNEPCNVSSESRICAVKVFVAGSSVSNRNVEITMESTLVHQYNERFLLSIMNPKILVTPDGIVTNGNLGGVAGADGICESVFGVGYKAMLSDGNTRIACSSSECVDGPSSNWIMSANTTYVNSENLKIFSTNESKIFIFGEITNPIDGLIDYSWTGLDADWQSSNANCNGWTTSFAISFGMPGLPGATNYEAISQDGFGTECDAGSLDSPPQIYCVQQQ